MRGTDIASLPAKFVVHGLLDLRDTPIIALPPNLTVGGNLDLRGTKITFLPENLTVWGVTYLSEIRSDFVLPTSMRGSGSVVRSQAQ